MNEERSRGKYTLEFKQEAVRQVKAGRVGMPKASLTNWVRVDAKGQLGMTADGRAAPLVTPERRICTAARSGRVRDVGLKLVELVRSCGLPTGPA